MPRRTAPKEPPQTPSDPPTVGASASVKKHGNRWCWTIVVRTANGFGHVYQGNEISWKLAWVMLEYTWFCHRLEWELPPKVKQAVVLSKVGVDNLPTAA